jgi:hypothetical protein
MDHPDLYKPIGDAIDDIQTLINYCSSSKQNRHACNTIYFWVYQFNKFNFPLDVTIHYNNIYEWIQLLYKTKYIVDDVNYVINSNGNLDNIYFSLHQVDVKQINDMIVKHFSSDMDTREFIYYVKEPFMNTTIEVVNIMKRYSLHIGISDKEDYEIIDVTSDKVCAFIYDLVKMSML